MRSFKKIMLTLMAVFTLTMILKTPAYAADAFTVSAINGKADYVELKWNQPTFDYTQYKILRYRIYNRNTGSQIADITDTDTLSYKITGLSKGYLGNYRVYCNYYYYDGQTVSTASVYDDVVAVTKPSDITKYYLYKLSGTTAGYTAARPANATGIQIDQYNAYTKKHTYKKCDNYADGFKAPYGVGIRYRIRTYYYNTYTKETYWGDWTAWKTYANFKLSSVLTASKKGITLTFPGTKQIKKYVITVAASSNGKQHKTATITASTKATSYVLKKIGSVNMKKNTRYYFYVTPYVKIGKKLFKSSMPIGYNFTNKK